MKFSERYNLRVPLGESELGAVWNALDRETDRGVVVVMLEEDAPEDLVSFFQETYAKLRDIEAPGIVKVLDLGITEDGEHYASVEKLEGETLAERLEGGDVEFTIGEVVGWVLTALEGLGAAHDAGIVHGDIDPGCLFLHEVDDEIHPKLISWGLNRARTRAGLHTPDSLDSEALLRSIAFTSPEQSEGGRAPIPADDLYGMAAILYDALAGELPRYGRDIETLRRAIQSGPVIPAAKVRTGIAGTLAATVDRALHQQPKRRPLTARIMVRGLRSSLGFSTRVIALPPREGRRSLEPSEFAAKAAAAAGPAKKELQAATPGAASVPKKAQHVVGKLPIGKRSDGVSGTLAGVAAPDEEPISVQTPEAEAVPAREPTVEISLDETEPVSTPQAALPLDKPPETATAPIDAAPAPRVAAYAPEPTLEISLDDVEPVPTPAEEAKKPQATAIP
ncbi:MAG: protein kinase, partial [Deltaproteobacteria bacterium]|nr:protein kinase [Deltaproteobacteria bacterium]